MTLLDFKWPAPSWWPPSSRVVGGNESTGDSFLSWAPHGLLFGENGPVMVKVVQDGPWLWNAPNWFSPGQTNRYIDHNSDETNSAPSPWMMISLVARMMREQKKYCIWSPCKVAPSLESGLAVGILAPAAHMHQPVHPNPTLGTAVGTLGTSKVEVLLYVSGRMGSTCSYAPTRASPLGTSLGASLLA